MTLDALKWAVIVSGYLWLGIGYAAKWVWHYLGG